MGSGETSYFTPLLFTKRRDDQEQPSTSYTIPRPSRSPRSPSSAGHASGFGAQRRRSMTPTGSTALMPAEPPLRSLYSDNFGAQRSSCLVSHSQMLRSYAQLTTVNYRGDWEQRKQPATRTSSVKSGKGSVISGEADKGANELCSNMHLSKHGSLQALTLDAGKDNVVTIFGFPNTEKAQAQVLQEFGKCGDILRFHRDTQCNWMHIQYAVGPCLTEHTVQWPSGDAATVTEPICLNSRVSVLASMSD